MTATHELVRWSLELAAKMDATDPDEWAALLGAEIDAYADDVEAKLDALVWVLDDLGGKADAIVERMRILRERKASFDAQRDRVRGMMLDLLEGHERLTGQSKVSTPSRTVYLAASTSLTYPDDLGEWPEDLIRHEPRADRAEAKRRLQAGESIEGFALVTKRGVRCR